MTLNSKRAGAGYTEKSVLKEDNRQLPLVHTYSRPILYIFNCQYEKTQKLSQAILHRSSISLLKGQFTQCIWLY
jgi:hypothetical protein